MASTSQTSGESLINRGLTLNLRSINLELTEYFQRYSIALNKIMGGELFGKTQTRQIQDRNGIPVEYAKGRIVFKNSIDKLKYLLNHRDLVQDAIGVDSEEIYSNRRNIQQMNKYLAMQDNKFDLGDIGSEMQMYVSKYDKNIGSLDSQQDWVDYILTQTWIDKLAAHTIDETTEKEQDSMLNDHRIEYLSDYIQSMMADHEIDYHDILDSFDPNMYLDLGKNSAYTDAFNKLRSFGKLDYGFYEIYKPIGVDNDDCERYIKVKLSTTGDLDISGVVNLKDCEHVEWEYGKPEYLRALNTGNERYDLKISLPFNDLSSILWWKPDEPEQLVVDEDEEGKVTEPTGWRYFKPYETERFLRWFGTNYIPFIDLDTITKKTVCSIPKLKDDVDAEDFYRDATSIASKGLPQRTSIDASTTLSLLSLQPKATIELINKMEPPGQYVRFIVTGEQQTVAMAFEVQGKMLNVIQEMHHYIHTWSFLNEAYLQLGKEILFLMVTSIMFPTIDEIWYRMFPDDDFIPNNWIELHEIFSNLQSPTTIDLLRFRQIDFESITLTIAMQESIRREFLHKMMMANDVDDDKDSKEGESKLNYVKRIVGDLDKVDEIMKLSADKNFYNEQLDEYINGFNAKLDDEEKQKEHDLNIEKIYENLPLGQSTKEQLLKKTLNKLHWLELTDAQKEERKKYEISFDSLTVDELRDRIETYNNLIVRLPVDTFNNKRASKHIFLDWKAFVDGAVKHMVENGESKDPDIPDNQKLYVKKNGDGSWFKVKGVGTEHKVD